MQKYLVSVDGSDNSLEALESAIELAKKTGGTITVLTVLNLSASAMNINAASYNNTLERNTNILREYLDDLVNRYASDEYEFEKLIRIGNASNEIIEESENHDLLFIGSRGLGTVQRTFLGSVSGKVVNNINIPAIVVKEKTNFKKILVPLDGSRHSKKALIKANEIGKHFESDLILLNVVNNINMPQMETFDLEIAMDFSDKAREESAKILDKSKSYIKAYPHNIETLSVEGDAATTILNIAEDRDVDLIAMGSQGLGALSRALMGSVSNEVVTKSHISVLIDR